MIDAVYVVFLWALVAESIVFILLNIPTPRGAKGWMVNFLSTNKFVGYIMYAHLIFCILALFFYFDLSQEESFFLSQKDRLKNEVDRHIGAELRIGFLSYTVLKIQRNKYITFMLIYTSIALNIFIHLLRHIYKQRELLEGAGYLSKPQRQNSDRIEPETLSKKSSSTEKKSN